MPSALRALLERSADAAVLAPLVRKYMDMLGVGLVPTVKISDRIGAKALGTTLWRILADQPSTITIQKSVLGDPATLERVLAHEMAHHAVNCDRDRELQKIVSGSAPADSRARVRDYVRQFQGLGHGKDWQAYAEVVNAKMGSGFVTPTSDASYVTTGTKPYYVLIGLLPNGKYGYQKGVGMRPKTQEAVRYAAAKYSAKLVLVKDRQWEQGPRIGSSKWAVPPDQTAVKALYADNL